MTAHRKPYNPLAPLYTAVVLAGVGFGGMLTLNTGSDNATFAAQSGSPEPLLSPSSGPIKILTAQPPESSSPSLKQAPATRLSASSAQDAHLLGSSAPTYLTSGSTPSSSVSSSLYAPAPLGQAGTATLVAGFTPLPAVSPAPSASASPSSAGKHEGKGSGTRTGGLAVPTATPTPSPTPSPKGHGRSHHPVTDGWPTSPATTHTYTPGAPAKPTKSATPAKTATPRFPVAPTETPITARNGYPTRYPTRQPDSRNHHHHGRSR